VSADFDPRKFIIESLNLRLFDLTFARLENSCFYYYYYYYYYTHTRLTALFPGLPGWAGTRKVKTNLDFTEARDSERQWHQLGHMQVCTSL